MTSQGIPRHFFSSVAIGTAPSQAFTFSLPRSLRDPESAIPLFVPHFGSERQARLSPNRNLIIENELRETPEPIIYAKYYQIKNSSSPPSPTPQLPHIEERPLRLTGNLGHLLADISPHSTKSTVRLSSS
jgi:hypothetical protein